MDKLQASMDRFSQHKNAQDVKNALDAKLAEKVKKARDAKKGQSSSNMSQDGDSRSTRKRSRQDETQGQERPPKRKVTVENASDEAKAEPSPPSYSGQAMPELLTILTSALAGTPVQPLIVYYTAGGARYIVLYAGQRVPAEVTLPQHVNIGMSLGLPDAGGDSNKG